MFSLSFCNDSKAVWVTTLNQTFHWTALGLFHAVRSFITACKRRWQKLRHHVNVHLLHCDDTLVVSYQFESTQHSKTPEVWRANTGFTSKYSLKNNNNNNITKQFYSGWAHVELAEHVLELGNQWKHEVLFINLKPRHIDGSATQHATVDVTAHLNNRCSSEISLRSTYTCTLTYIHV